MYTNMSSIHILRSGSPSRSIHPSGKKNDTKNEKTVLGNQKRVFWTACILFIIVETSTLMIKKESSKSDNFRRKSIGGSLMIFLKISTKLTNSQQEVSKVRCQTLPKPGFYRKLFFFENQHFVCCIAAP